MSNKYKNGNHKNKVTETRTRTESMFLLLPLILIVTVLPLIVKAHSYKTGLSVFDWFSITDEFTDFFLYYKQWFFVAICGAIVCIICFRAFIDKKTIRFSPIFLPLGLYAFLSLLSTVVSKYSKFGFTGMFEQFENVFCLIGYALVVYYAFLIIRTEDEVRLMIDALAVGALLVCSIGAFQAFGLDIYSANYEITMAKGHTYASLYNPNYVGVYTSFLIPMFFVLLINAKKRYQHILYSLVLLTSVISLFGSQSKAGFVGIIIAACFILIFLRKTLLKKWKIILPIVFIMIASFFVVNKINHNTYINAIKNALHITKQPEPALTSIETKEDGIYITYKGNTLIATIDVIDNVLSLQAVDLDNNSIDYTLAEDGITYLFTDERFAGITMFPALHNEMYAMGINIDNTNWYFTNFTESGEYQYFNRYGNLSPIKTPETAVFNGYENFATSRGYIWSRTIPLLKDYIFLGSGADTYAIAFPQYDYVGFHNYGYMEQLLTKPHSLYLQVAVQTGVISLLAILAFYMMYFIRCIKLYMNDTTNHKLVSMGIAIFIGTISYMVSALTNDSSIAVAPVFWVMIGVGVAINEIVKRNQFDSKSLNERK